MHYAVAGDGLFFGLRTVAVPTSRTFLHCDDRDIVGIRMVVGAVKRTELDLRVSSALPMHPDVAIIRDHSFQRNAEF